MSFVEFMEFKNFMQESFDDLVKSAKVEGNYYTGYKKIFVAYEMDDEEQWAGLEICRKATNATQTIYRVHRDLVKLEEDRQGAVLEMIRNGEDTTSKSCVVRLAEFDKPIRKVQHTILTAAFDLAQLREPLEEFLGLTGIPARTKYNKKGASDDEG